MKKFNKNGFTLIEMLVVIAIIAVLVSIVIPTVSSSTEKAKEAADAANIRAYIAEVTTDALTGKTDTTRTYTMQQTGDLESITTIGGLSATEFAKLHSASSITISWDASAKAVTITTG